MNLIQYSCFHLSVLYCMGWQLDILRASWGKLASNYYNSRFIIISGCDYLSPDSTTLKRFVFSSFRSVSASQRDTTERRRQLEVKNRSMGLETCSCTWRMHHELWKLLMFAQLSLAAWTCSHGWKAAALGFKPLVHILCLSQTEKESGLSSRQQRVWFVPLGTFC